MVARDRRPSFRSHRRRVRNYRSFVSERTAGQSVKRAASGFYVVGIRNGSVERVAQARALLALRRCGHLTHSCADLGDLGAALLDLLGDVRRDAAPLAVLVHELEHLGLRGRERGEEHARFLRWRLAVVRNLDRERLLFGVVAQLEELLHAGRHLLLLLLLLRRREPARLRRGEPAWLRRGRCQRDSGRLLRRCRPGRWSLRIGPTGAQWNYAQG